MTLGVYSAWLATLVSVGVIGWSIYKVVKKIKGKSLMAKMLTDFKNSGGKI